MPKGYCFVRLSVGGNLILWPTRKKLDEIGAYLIRNKYNVAVAESVTAGLIQNVISGIECASGFFEGGITAYNLKQKCTHLSIDPAHAIQCNCVSERVANEMALGVANSFHADWGLAITGYASIAPDVGVTSLYCCYAFVFNQQLIKSCTVTAVEDDPGEVQRFYMRTLIEDFIQICPVTEK